MDEKHLDYKAHHTTYLPITMLQLAQRVSKHKHKAPGYLTALCWPLFKANYVVRSTVLQLFMHNYVSTLWHNGAFDLWQKV